jgi:putative tryptophan/tyrosine transport system substrate-binding protein
MRRREFITLLGGAAASTALLQCAARAQQGGRVRRIGWLIDRDENDPQVQTNKAALRETLAKLGWIEGRNLRIDFRFGARDLNRIHVVAAELVSLAPEVIVTNGGATTLELQQRTKTIPIVFTAGPDPVSAGLVRNIPRPEGNTTGFPSFEPSIGGKWLALLKEAAPRLAKVSVIFNPGLVTPGDANNIITSIQAAASAFGVEAIQTPVRNSVDAVRVIDAFAAEPNGSLLVLPPPPSVAIRDAILQLAAQHRLPAIYGYRELAAAGGLMSYGTIIADQYRGAATYVDRLLRGAKVNELPVQFPTRYELVVNLKAAKAIGLTIPEAFLLRADELIE